MNNSTVSTTSLPIFNQNFNSVVVASISVVKNSFLELYLNANIEKSSSINIIIPGLSPLNLKGNLDNVFLRIGSDINGTLPFNQAQTITIMFNCALNETINVKLLNYKLINVIDYKKIIIIFLIVYFFISFYFKK